MPAHANVLPKAMHCLSFSKKNCGQHAGVSRAALAANYATSFGFHAKSLHANN